MNRQQRRKAEKATPAYRRGMSAEELIKRMSQSGITVQQYDDARQKEYEHGYKEGLEQGRIDAAKQCYAAAALAMRDVLGYGKQRIVKVLTAMDRHVEYTLDSEEAIDKVWDECGIQLEFHNPDPFEGRIKEVDKK